MKALHLIPIDNRHQYINFLLLADEDETIINQYILEGEMYAISYKGTEIGVSLFTFPSIETVEIKNLALSPAFRGKGIGRQVLHKAAQVFKERRFRDMIAGTSNSSIENLAFYQKAGFRFYDIKKDFFTSYPEPFYENGIKGIDMIVFRKSIQD